MNNINSKKKVKYTPPKDKTIPKELKKDKPISSAAEAQEDIEENLPKSTRKEEGSEKSLSKIQDDLDKGDISPKEAQKKAGIEEDAKDLKDAKKAMEEKGEIPWEQVKAKMAKVDKVKKPEKFKKITLEDGHTYTSDEEDTICTNCGLPKNKTTTQCFKRTLSPVGLVKFNKGLIDYAEGNWVSLKEEEV